MHVLLTLWYKRNEQTGNLHILQHTVTINAAEQLDWLLRNELKWTKMICLKLLFLMMTMQKY